MPTDLFLAVEKNPQDVKAFETLIKTAVAADDRATLDEVYQAVPRWAPDNAQNHMVRILSQYARQAPNPDIGGWLAYRNGRLFWKTYKDPQMAEMAFRKVETLPEAGAADELRAFYIEFYVAQNNWRRLEQVLTEPNKGGYDDPIEVRRLLGRLAEEKDQGDKAVAFWVAVRQSVEDDREAEEALRRLYAKLGKWNSMVELLKEELDKLPPEHIDEKTLILLEMIDIYKNRLAAPAKVVASWQAILDIDPSNVQALDALAAEYTEMKRWPDLVKVLGQKVAHEIEPKKLIALHRQIAQIMQERFSNAGEAIKSYEAILELEPGNREALKTLKDIHEQRRDYDSFVAVSERELELLDPKQQFGPLVALAKLASEKLRKPQTPIALWERVLDYEPNHREALVELENWFEREKNWARLSEILERRVGLEKDIASQVNLLDKLGTVAQTRLNDAEKAAEVWRQILSRDRDHRKAQGELRKKYIAERDWDGLEWFFRNYGEVGEWVRTLEQQLKTLDDPEERVALLFKTAAVWKNELKDTRRATKNLESVLEIEPRHAETAQMLIPIYHELGSWRDLPNVYEIALESTEDTDARKALLLALADVQEKRLGDVEAAFFAYVQAVSESPGDTALHPKLRALAEASSNWESYVHVLQDAVDHVEPDTARAQALLEIGLVYRDRLGADETSLSFFYRVLGLDPYNRQALDAAERAWENTGAYDQLVLCYQKRIATADDPQERLNTLFKLVDIWRTAIHANDEAEAVLREMLEDFPNELRVHDALIDIHLEEKRFVDLRDVLEKKRDVLLTQKTHPGALADLECQLGMLAFGTIDDATDAVPAAIDRYEAALRHVPGHELSVARLEELISHEADRLRITRLLAPVYETRQDFDSLSQMLEIQWAAASADEDAVTQVELLTRLGDLYRSAPLHLATPSPELAWRTQARFFALRPENAAVRAELQDLTAELSHWDKLVSLYSQEADTPLDKQSRLAVKLEVARIWHKRLGNLEEARVFYQRVREEDVEHKEAIDALEEIFVALDRAEELLEVYRGQIDLAKDVGKKLDYLFRTVDLVRDRLESPEDAIAPAREALALSPGHDGAVGRLEGLYASTERWEDLAQMFDETIRVVSANRDRVIALKHKLALVNEQHLERPDFAIEIHASVLSDAPSNADAITSLERLFAREELAPTVAPILQPVYERNGDWQKLVAVYTVRENAAPDYRAKIDWLYKIADLHEVSAQQPELAFENFEAAALLEPGSVRTLNELLRLADALDNHGELVLFLLSIVEDIPALDRRIETHRTIALLARDKTRDLDGAEKQFRAILELDPNDMAATDALVALYRGRNATASLVEMLLKKANMNATGVAERNALHEEAGHLAADGLNDAPQAIEIFETLHRLDPNGEVALDNLEALYERTEDWENLVRIYREKIDRAVDLERKKHFASLMGFVQDERLESPDDAIATWLQILAWDPKEADALVQLDALYTKQADWFNLRETLRKLQANLDADGFGTSAEWDRAQFRIAKLYEDTERLGDLDAAIDCYGVLLSRNLQHVEAVTSLEAILAERESWEKAFATLRPVLEKRESFEELWQQYEVLVAHQVEDGERQTQSLHQMADLAEIRLADPTRALEAHARAFQVAPRNAHTVAELERLAAEYTFWEQLVAIYDGGAEGDDEYLALELRLKSSAILMDRIGDLARATAHYERIRKDHPEHGEVLARLHRLYEAREMWPELANILRTQADIENEPTARIAFLDKLAQVAEVRLGDAQRAYEAFVEILDLDRTSSLAIRELRRLFENGTNPLDIADRLEPIYREGSRWEELDSLLQLKLTVLDKRDDQLQLMRDLAILAIEKRGNELDAIEWYGQAFLLDPDDDGLLGELERLASLTAAWARLDHFLNAAADVVKDNDRKVQLWHRSGAVARDQLANVVEAERVFRLVIAVEPGNADALRALDRILVAASRWQDLEPVLVAMTTATDLFDDERMQVWTRLAELYRDRLGRPEDSIEAWKQVLELQDTNEVALHALRAMYSEAELWPELFAILETLSEGAREPAERVSYFADMARIAEVSLGKPARAVELWEDVLATNPSDLDAVRELQRLTFDLGEAAAGTERSKLFGNLVEAYERELRMGVPLDAARKLELFRQIGRLWQSELDDPFNAQNAWERARNEEPFDREALDALRGLHATSGNDQARAEILEAAIASGAYSDDELLGLWRDLGQIRTEVFNDRPGAIECWQAVLGFAPTDTQAIDNLEVLYENTQRWQDLVELFTRKLPLIADLEERIETWLQIGAIQHDNLQNPSGAASTYRAILESEGPSSAEEGETLRSLKLETSQRLDRIYEAAGQWAELAELLLARNDRLDKEDKLPNLQRLARIHEERLSAVEDAFLVLQSANELVPDDPQVLAELERLAGLSNLWNELFEVYEATIPHVEEDVRIELMLKSAGLQRDRIGASSEAIRLYERVLSVNRENEPALRALATLDEGAQRWPELVAVLTTLADVTPSYDEKKSLFEQIARVEEQHRKNLDAAVVAWNQVLEMDERDEAVLHELARLHALRSDWHALIEVFEKEAMVDPTKEVALRIQIADVYERYTRQIDKAIEAYEDVLGIDSSNEFALDKLEGIYSDRGDYDSLLDVYERAFNAAKNDEDRLRMAKNAAILHEEVRQDLGAAADAWNRVLNLEPHDTQAIDALVRIHTAEAQWDDLIRVHEHRYENADGPEGRAEALLSMAAVYRDNLDDPDNAISMFERVLLERNGDFTALHALDDLYAKQGQWELVVENIDKMLEHETDGAARVQLLCRQGHVARHELENHVRASQSYSQVLREAPGHAEAIEELLGLHRQEEQWDKVIEVLEHKLAHARRPTDRAAVHIDLADVLSDKLGQPDKALAHFEQAEKADPDSRRALEVLADHYMRNTSWAMAMTRLEALVDKLDTGRDRQLLGQTHTKIGLCAEALYLDDQAIDSLNLAASFVPLERDGLHALGRIHYRRENYREAERYLTELLQKYRRDLSGDDHVEVLMQLGESALKSKNIDRARVYLKQVVDAQPDNRDAIEKIIEVLRVYGEWNEAVRYQERLLELETDKAERNRILIAIGDTYQQELNEPYRAIDAYKRALDLEIFPKEAALRLFELYYKLNDMPRAMSNLNRLITLEDDPKTKGRYALMGAVVYRDALNEPNEAVKYFNIALDNDLDKLDAFASIDKILTTARDWKALEQNYRKMIGRVRDAKVPVPNADALNFKLFMNLGEIYRNRMKQADKAIVSFELAREKRPDDVNLREILVELYESTPDAVDKAIKEHRWLIAKQPNRYDSYHKLVQLFRTAKQYDAAWCVSALLVALRNAQPDEQSFYEAYRPVMMAEPKRVIDQALWMQCIMSREEDIELGRIIEIVYAGLGKSRLAKPVKEFNLKKKSRLELEDGSLLSNTTRNALRMFGLPAPEMHKGEEAKGVEFLQTDPPMLRFGTDTQSGLSDKELAFRITRRLSYFMPSHLVAILYPREALDGLYLGAAVLVDPNYQVPTHEGVDAATRQSLLNAAADIRTVLDKNLAAAPDLRQELVTTMRNLWKRTPVPELGRWHKAIELTAIHAGIVACNDPAVSLIELQQEQTGLSRLTKQDKLRDHVIYVLGEPYLQLRKQLGLQIDYSDLKVR